MPEHLVALLSEDFICDIIGLCDVILYRVLVDVLIPSTIQDVPENLVGEIKMFIRKFPMWLSSSLEDVPEAILQKKKEVLAMLLSSLRRQLSFIHVAQAARPVLSCTETVNNMLRDLDNMDLAKICVQTGLVDTTMFGDKSRDVAECFTELKSLLSKQSGVESITEWLDNIIDACVLQCRNDDDIRTRSAEFLLQWTVAGSLVMRDMTLGGATSFGALHLLHILCDEYVFLVMETQSHQTLEKALREAVKARQSDKHKQISINDPKQTILHKSRPSSPMNCVKSRKRKLAEMNNDSKSGTCDKFNKNIHETDKAKDSEVRDHKTEFPAMEPSSKDHSSSYPSNALPTYIPQVPAPLSPVKSHQMAPQSYYPHLSYHDYSIHNPRIADNFTPGLNMAAPKTGPPYWNHDGRGYYDHNAYTGYTCCSKWAGTTYDSYGRSATLLRGNFGQDGYSRSAFDATRSYYSRNQDNYGSFSQNYVDFVGGPITSPHGQYGRQDAIFTPVAEEISTGGYTGSYGHALTKSLVSQFR